MSQQIIDTGGEAGAGGGDDLFTAFTKINDNFTEIYSGNVTAANLRVYSVAGRIGNVVLTAQDVFGAATYSNIAVLQQNINAAIVTAQNYTDASIGNLGPLSNVEITGGTIKANLNSSWGTLVNLSVSGNQTIGGQLSVTQGASIGGTLVLGDQLVFDDSTVQTTAFQGFGNIFSNALAQSQAIAAISANLNAVSALANTLVGNLSIVGTTIYVQNSGEEITLQPDGTGNVYIGQSGANDLVLGKGIWFDDGTYQDTAYIPGGYVTATELSSNVSVLGQRIDAANAAIAVNTNRVAAANAVIAALSSVVSAQAISDAGNVAAANAVIASTNAKIAAANAHIATTNANVAAANAHIVTLISDVSSLQTDVATLQSDLASNIAPLVTNAAVQAAAISSLQTARAATNANVSAANAVIATLQSTTSATNANVAAANAVIANNTADIITLNSDLANLTLDVGNTQDGLDLANAAITALQSTTSATNANLTAANSAISTVQSNITGLQSNAAVQAVAIDLINANLTAANAAVLSVSSRISAANLEIGKLRANITAANAHIASNTSDISTLQTDVSDLMVDVGSLQAGLDLANTNIIHNADVYTDLSDAANVAIAALGANITAANSVIVSVQAGLDAANVEIAALGAIDLNSLNANVTAANAVIAFQGARITTSNVLIAQVRANVTAANARINSLETALSSTDANVAAANIIIASLGSGNLNQIEANIAGANVRIAELRANITASNVRIGRLESNIGAGLYANSALISTDANVAGANAAISAISSTLADLYSNAATQSAAIFSLQGNALSQQNAINAKAPVLNPSLTGTVDVAGDVVASGNVTAAFVLGQVGIFTDLYGQIRTANQPLITAVGTLSSLTVSGNISAAGITSLQGFTGQLKTAAQPLVTSLGTLTGLSINGTTEGRGFVGNTVTMDTSVTAPLVSASTLTGTIGTAAQPNITSLGNLTALAVDGTTNLNDIIVAGNIRANAALSSLAVNSLQTSTARAVTANITTLANIEAIQGNSAVFGLDVQANNFISVYDINATRVIATGFSGILETAAQPNVTSLGTLTGLAVTGNVDVTGNVNTSANVSGSWFVGNVLGRTAQFAGNVSTGNLSAAYITGVVRTSYQPYINELGNLQYLNVDGDATITGNLQINSQYGLLAATQGTFNIIDGYLTNATQPNVTTLGTLTGLSVAGTVNVTGDQYITQDLWILGNMYVNGNTTTVSAGNVTTTDKDLTLANDAVSSTAARGAGIYIGDGGIYGNLSIYDGTWATPNNFNIGGTLAVPSATFTTLAGTLTTAAQPNITSVGTLTSLTVAGLTNTNSLTVVTAGSFANVNTGNLRSTSVSAVTGDFENLNVAFDVIFGGLTTVSNIVFGDGSFQTTTANLAVASNLALINANVIAANIEIANLQANIAAANTVIATNTSDISTLYSNAATQQTEIDSINANVTAANATIAGTAGDISTLYSNAATQQTEIDSINANVTAANLEISSTNANVAAANAVIAVLNTVNLSGDPTFAGNVTVGSLLSRGNVESGGPYATGNTTIWNNAGQATITTNSANLYINNFNAGVYATPFLGNVILNANLQVFGNLVTASNANLYTGNVWAYDGSFNNLAGTLTTAAQPNITSVGTLTGLSVTGNVTTGNVSGAKGTFGQVEGTLTTALQPAITLVGTLSDLTVSGNTSTGNLNVANLTVTNSFALTAGSLNLAGDISAANLVINGNTQLANAAVTGNLSAGSNLYVTGIGSFDGNISTTAQGLRTANSTLDNNLYTAFITATGNLAVTGNASTASLSTGPIDALTMNLTGGTPATNPTTGALTVLGGAGIGGELWTGGNANVGGSLRTTNIIAEGPVYFKGQINLDNGIIETNQSGVALFNNASTDYIVLGSSAIDIKIGDENPVAPYYGQGNTYIRHSLSVAGNLHANSNAIVKSTAESDGAYSGALQVFGGAWFGANIWAGGNLDVGGTSRITGNTYIGGTAYVAGNTTIAANTAITGTTTITGNIRTSGSNLLIVANTSVTGDSSIIGNLTIVAPFRPLSNTLTVTGNVAFRNNLHVKNNIYADQVIVSGGIGGSSLDDTPIGQNIPNTGNFTSLAFLTLSQGRLRSNQRPRLLLDFANNQTLDPRLTFARNSIGTYFDTSGNLATANADQPRFTNDPVTLTPLGMLIEESRTNYFKYSAAQTDANYWDSLGGSVQTLANTTNPTGGFVGGCEIIENADTVLHGVYPDATNNQITALSTYYYAASAFVKAGLRTQFTIQLENEGTGPIFDTVTGTVYQEGTAPGGFTTASEIRPQGNGWFRISTVLYKQTTNGNVIFALAEGGSITYAGQAGAAGGFIYGAQLEIGSFPTSYIPTTTASVTREADDVTISSTNFTSVYDGNDGLLYVDSVVNHAPTNKTGALPGVTPVTEILRPTLVSIEGATAANRIALVTENTTIPTASRFGNLIVYNGGTIQGNLGATDTHFLTTTTGRIAAYFNTNSFGLTTNGNAAVADVSGTVPSNLTVMYIGRGTATSYLNGTILKLSYYSRTSTSATISDELRALTAQ